MSLDKILKKIDKEASSEIEEIINDAKEKVSKIKNDGEKELDRLKSELEKEKISVDQEIKNTIILPARLEVKGAILKIKRELLDKAFHQALDFDKKEYKNALEKLMKDVKIHKDAELYPAKEKEDVIKEFVKDKGLDVKIKESLPDIVGGFIIKEKKVEYDCSFKALLRNLKDKLEPKVASIFEEKE